MRSEKLLASALLFFIVAGSWACSTQLAESPAAEIVANAPLASGDREIDAALKFIEKVPESPIGYNQLAVLYMRRSRQTGDPSFNAKAETAINRALEFEPADPAARKLKASLHLSFHRFNEAAGLAKELNKEFPDDAFVYGVFTDANAELGNYPEAVAAAQKMVDLKPNSNAYARVAHLRSLHGDHLGAIEMYRLAARTADPQDQEAQSWCLVQLGNELWRNGKYAESVKVYDEALSLIPDYELAILARIKALASLKDYDGVINALSSFEGAESDPDANVLLAHIYSRKGEEQKSDESLRRGEAAEQENLGKAGEQLHLAALWADHNINLPQALSIAEAEFVRQKDIYTADILAWCLYKNGRYAEAKKLSDKAMSLKTNDARLYYHAGMIAKELGDRGGSRRLIEKALRLNPEFDLRQADMARSTLSQLKG